MNQKIPKRRNPLARAVRQMRPQVVKSAKAYKRHDKHKGSLQKSRLRETQDGFSLRARTLGVVSLPIYHQCNVTNHPIGIV